MSKEVIVYVDVETGEWKQAIPCPGHQGAYDCTPFCNLCEGTQQIDLTTV